MRVSAGAICHEPIRQRSASPKRPTTAATSNRAMLLTTQPATFLLLAEAAG
jgi:hypothetical protein